MYIFNWVRMHRIDGMVIYVNAQHACNCDGIQIIHVLKYDQDYIKINQHYENAFKLEKNYIINNK